MKNRGITLIALIVTIVVLLILAGITIGTLTGENGLIGNSKEAKEQTEIANEKEALEQAIVKAMGEGSYGKIEIDNLEEEIKNIVGEGKTQISDLGDRFEIEFIESNRYYEVDTDGNVGDYQEIIKDQYPGDITKDKDGNLLDGNLENPYEIWCIEDLIEWSKNYLIYKNSTIILGRELNFKSSMSYANSKTKEYEDINEDGDIETLIEEMQKGKGFTPIENFSGNFDGKNQEIKNIYIKNEGNVGFFRMIENAVVESLGITGYIESTGEVKVNYGVGGIVGLERGNYCILNIWNSYNTGEIKSDDRTSGILGAQWAEGSSNIENCYNIGSCKNGICIEEKSVTTANIYYLESVSETGGISTAKPITEEYLKTPEFINELNQYIKDNEEKAQNNNWRNWQLGEKGYPIFQ